MPVGGDLFTEVIWEPALEVRGGVSPLVVSRPVDPDNETARLAGYAGTMVLYLIVDSNGEVRDIHVYQTVGREVDTRVVHTVRRWKFRTGQKNGPEALQQFAAVL